MALHLVNSVYKITYKAFYICHAVVNDTALMLRDEGRAEVDDFTIDAVARTGAFGSLAITSNDPPHSSGQAWETAMAAASSKRSAAEQSQLSSANAPATDKTELLDHNGDGSRIDCGLGILQAGVGLEVVGGLGGGILTSDTGIGAAASGGVAWHGRDDIQTGVRQAWTGKPTETSSQERTAEAADWPAHQFQPPPWPGGKFTGFWAGLVAGAKDTLFHTSYLEKKLHQGDWLFNAGVFVGLMVVVPFAALGAKSAPTGSSAGATVERATVAFHPGLQLEGGLGIFAERELTVTKKGLDQVKAHLARPEFGGAIDPIENAMVQRLENALGSGKRVSGADAIFYTHELAEATMMARGILYEEAHAAALQKYGVSPLSVFHPDVIHSLPPGYLNYRWYQFWGIK